MSTDVYIYLTGHKCVRSYSYRRGLLRCLSSIGGQCEGLNCGISDRCSSHVFVFIWSYQFIIYSFIKTLCVGNLQALNNVICKKLILFPQHGFGLIFGRRFCFPCYALQLFLVATNCVWYSPKDRKDLLGSRLTKYRWTR